MWCYSLFQSSFVPVFLLCIVIVKYIACLCVLEPASQLKAYCFMWLCFKSVRRTIRRNMELFCFSQLFLLMLLVFSFEFKLLCSHLLCVWRTLPVRFLSFIIIHVCDLEASTAVLLQVCYKDKVCVTDCTFIWIMHPSRLTLMNSNRC